MKVREVITYKEYFDDFFKKQPQKVRDKIIKVLDIIEQIDRIPTTYLKYIEGTNGLFEVRVQLGNNIFRIFCFFDGNKLVVLLSGFQKKTQKTPPEEIKRAERLMTDYYKEKEKENHMDILLKAIPIAIPVILVILIFLMGYVKAPPDVAYIISGLRKHPKVLIGKAGIKIPFLERVDKLIVRQISIDIKSEGYIPTQDFIGVDVDAVAKVRVMTDPEGIQLAMKNFLNMTEDDFNRAIVDSLQGNMREIIGTITLKEICNDRKKFGDEVQSKAQTDMNALGIQIISCNIQRVTDENSLINSLGQDNMSKIQKDAAIAKAEAERDIAIAQAQAAKASNDAQVEADMHIAQKQNDLAIKQSELKVQEDTKRAEADAAYTIQQQEQQRSIETATVNAQIAKTEREAELKSKEVEVKKQSLDAEVRAAADADRYRKEQEAQAALYQRQKDAEAVRYEQEQAAEAAKKAAEAARFAKEQEAAGIAAVGQAEAEAIRAKALAEAEGIDKKAEAMKKYGEAAVIEMIMNALPEIAKNVAEPLSKVDKITMYGEGNSAKLLSDIVNGTTQVTEGISAGMGLDLKSLLAGALGGKLAAGNSQPVQVTVAPQAQPDAAAASADTPEQQV